MHILPLREAAFAGLPADYYARVAPTPLGEPYWVATNQQLAAELGLPENFFAESGVLAALSGSAKHYQPAPLAGVYSGHQFGVYVPQLGDGRALLLGESEDAQGRVWEWQLKGAGKTPFSRFADGRAVLRSSIREYLCSEAMHALGIPTTRALALTGSNDAVFREEPETAAVVTRIAPSFLRFGHFEFFYHSGRHHQLQPLADFLLAHHYPEPAGSGQPYLALVAAICARTAELMAAWQAVGFCHGVMNTDNMSALGLTIDYGPFGFLDHYDPRHVCNHSDNGGRYAYNEQPYVAQWNLSRLASCFLPLCEEADLVDVLKRYPDQYQAAYLKRMRAKLGLQTEQKGDEDLVAELLASLQSRQVDYTLLFRRLSDIGRPGNPIPDSLIELFGNHDHSSFGQWRERYLLRLQAETGSDAERKARMDAVNPLYVLRNYLLEQAIAQAKNGDFREIGRLQRCLQHPFTEQAEFADFAGTAPEWAGSICVSCSS